jgi:hypothetical protein
MIPDPVETLLQARNTDETTFRNLVRQLGPPGALADRLFDGTRSPPPKRQLQD